MKVGDKFRSFADFEAAFSVYKKKVLNEFTVRDARTLENQRKRCPDTVNKANNSLRYYHIRMFCIKGGKKFKSRNENSSRKGLTMKQNCKASIFLKLSNCQQFIQVKEFNEVHNHSSSKTYFSSLAQQRLNISPKLKADVRELLNTKANKKIVLDNVRNATGCNITLKDLTNLNRKTNKKTFEECISLLRDKYECSVIEILVNSSGVFKGLFFQDERMQKYMQAYPEVIFIDGTYCLVDLRTATYIIMVEDGNGVSEIAGIGLLVDETEESIDFFITSFKNNNAAWTDVHVVMSDKDKTERKVFSKHFPNSKLMICLFHVFQIFHREVSSKKMKISSEQANISKKYLQRLTYSRSEKEYLSTLDDMKKNVPEVVIKYFNDNWANIEDQWVKYLSFQNLCLSNSTNNRLESLNARLKSVVTRYSPLEDFIKHVFILLNSYRVSKDVKISQMLSKISTKPFLAGSSKRLYCDFLTTFAFESVETQIDFTQSVKQCVAMSNNSFLVTSSEGLLQVTPTSCECLFRKSNMLPCRHIFKCRELLKMPLFDADLCLPRWTRQFTRDLLDRTVSDDDSSIKDNINNSQSLMNIIQQSDTNTILTGSRKYKLAADHTKIMAQLCSEVSTAVFHKRVMVMENIIKIWSEGKDQLLDSALCGIFQQNNGNQEKNILKEKEAHSGPSNAGKSEAMKQKKSEENSCTVTETQHDPSVKQKSLEENFYTEEDFRKSIKEEILFPTKGHDYLMVEKDNLTFDCVEEVVEHEDNQVKDVNTDGASNVISLCDIQMPSTLKKRGRPKGFGQTVLGFKCRKTK